MTQLISNVLMQPTDAVERLTLIEKLEQARDNHNYYLKTCGNDRDKAYHSFGKKCYQKAIDIVKQHSDWVRCDERLPYAEEMLTNHYEPKEFYEIILKTGELLIASYTHMKNDGNNEILFMDCTIALTDGEWGLLDGGFSVYEVDEVAYWKPIKPPSEVQK